MDIVTPAAMYRVKDAHDTVKLAPARQLRRTNLRKAIITTGNCPLCKQHDLVPGANAHLPECSSGYNCNLCGQNTAPSSEAMSCAPCGANVCPSCSQRQLSGWPGLLWLALVCAPSGLFVTCDCWYPVVGLASALFPIGAIVRYILPEAPSCLLLSCVFATPN
jgi:hypothetical protein